MSNLNEASKKVSDFIKYLSSHGVSLNSLKYYKSDILSFLNWANGRMINSSLIKEYITSQLGLSSLKTINRRLSTLRSFSQSINVPFMAGIGNVSVNGTKKIIEPNNILNFDKFLIDQKVSNNTRRNYLSDIRKFLTWKRDTEGGAKEYLNNLPISSYNRNSASLKKYYEFQNKSFPINSIRIPKNSSYRFIQELILNKFDSKPRLQNVFHKLFFNRPNWYIRYHSYPLANYIHIAILILITSISGYAIYDQVFKNTKSTSAYPTTLETPNRFLSFQGRLTDQYGNPKIVATDLVFKLYDAVSAGNTLWDSTTCSITPDGDGIFSTLLGSTCGGAILATVFSENADVWLGITIGADAEATPRIRIATVGYALNSETLQGFPPGTGTSTIPYIDSTGKLAIAAASPTIESTSGTFAVTGQAMTISTANTTNGSIAINPDGTGTLNLTFEGAAAGGAVNGFLNATNANITSGALYGGTVVSDATGYNFVDFQSGASPTSKFSVDYAGNTTMAGDLKLGGVDILDTNGLELLRFTATGSAVDELTIANAATGGVVTLAATGGDTDVALSIDAKGADPVNIAGTSTGGVNIAGSGTGDVAIAGGSGSTGCTITNSNGNLTCSGTISGTFSIAADSLNFTEFIDAMSLDADTSIAFDATESLTFDATTIDTTEVGGVLDFNIDAGNADGVTGLNIDFAQTSGADAGFDATAAKINLTANDADGDMFGLIINGLATVNAAAGSYEAGIKIDNAENIAGSMTDGILITATTDTATTDAIDVSDAELVNAINVGANTILGTTGLIDYTNFDVDASGNVTAAQGNWTTLHTTTLLSDHIGEHTGAHGVVFDNNLDIQTYTLSGSTAVVDFTDFDIDADGLMVFATDGAGDQITMTSPAADFQALVVNATAADSTQVGGMIDLNIDTSTTTAIGGMSLSLTDVADAGNDTIYGNKLDYTLETDASGVDTVYGQYIGITANDADSTTYGLAVITEDAGTQVATTGILIENLQATDIDLTDGLLIRATTADSIVDAIDVSDAEITNAINVGANTILGTTGLIDYTNFDVDASGNITGAGTTGLTLSGSGGDITFANGEKIDNDTDGTIAITGTLKLNSDIITNSAGNSTILLTGTPEASNQNHQLASGSWLVTNSVNNTLPALTVNQAMAGDIFVASDSAVPVFVIRDGGNVGIGKTVPLSKLHIADTSTSEPRGITNDQFSADATASLISLRKSRNATIGSHTVVQSGDTLGRVAGYGSDGTGFIEAGAIKFASDGTPGTNDMPGRITFSTTADGAASTTERMRIDSSGNVGIGTTGSASLLEIQGGLTTTGAILTLGTKETTVVDGDVLGKINFYAPLEDDGSDAILVGASIWAEADATFTTTVNSTELVFATGTSEAATEKMRIDSAGNVGVGTTGPSSLLHVKGGTPILTISDTGNNYNNGDIQSSIYLSGRWSSGVANPDADAWNDAVIKLFKDSADGGGGAGLSFWTSGAGTAGLGEKVRIDKNGYFGIGTTVPGVKLEVNGNVRISDGTDYLDIDSTDATWTTFRRTSGGATGTSELGIDVNGNVYIDGSLGIGTTSPQWNFEVTANVSVTMGASSYGTGVNPTLDLASPRGTRASPSLNLVDDILGIIYFRGWDDSLQYSASIKGEADGEFYTASDTTDTPGRLVFSTTANGAGSPTERMRITNAGDVGIGNTDPTFKFEISSNATDYIMNSTFGTGVTSGLIFYNANGTRASQTATQTGDTLGAIFFQGFDTARSTGAKIWATAANTWGGTATDDPTDLHLCTVPDASGTCTERLTILSTGLIGIGVTAPSYALDVSDNVTGIGRFTTSASAATGATIRLYQNSTTPAVSDIIGIIAFEGNDLAAATTDFSEIRSVITNITDTTEQSKIQFYNFDAGAANLAAYIDGPGTVYADVGTGTFSPYYSYNFIPADKNKSDFEYGDVVKLKPGTNKEIDFTNSSNDPLAYGVVHPPEGYGSIPEEFKSVVMGDDTEAANLDNYPIVPVAHLGTAITKVYLKPGEKINTGDAITSSEIARYGQKSTQAGTIIGKSNQQFDPDSLSCITIPNIESVVWPDDPSKTNNTKPCFVLPDGSHIGKVMVFVNVSWNDPDVFLTSTGDLNIEKVVGTDQYIVKNSKDNNLISQIGTFAEIVVAKLKAGVIETKELTTETFTTLQASIDNLIVNNKIISPVVQTNLISPIANTDLIIDLQPDNSQVASELVIKGENDSKVASVDSLGNASFSGELASNSLEVTTNATISGTLHADNIESSKLDEIESLLKSVEESQSILADSANWNINTATSSASIDKLVSNEIITNNFFVTGNAAVASLFVSDNFTTNSINSLDTTLSIQSLALAPLEIMAGKITIGTNGDVTFLGNVEIAGNLELKGNIVVAVDSTNIASTSAEIVQGEINTNATAGKAILLANTNEIKIVNPKINTDTLIYVTPLSSTQNKVLYVKSKDTGSFTVGFSESIDTDVEFNWWVIELQNNAN